MKMEVSDNQILTLLALILSLVMTLLALASYRSYETTKKRLVEREAELKLVQTGAEQFRQKTSDAFMDQKSLKLHIDTLERSLALAREQLQEKENENKRLQDDLTQLRNQYETTKLNLTEAYKRLRETPQSEAGSR
jgi:peptidoglycan hydrolase CwlO-like protein